MINQNEIRILLISDQPDDAAFINSLLDQVKFTHYKLEYSDHYDEHFTQGSNFDVCLVQYAINNHSGLSLIRKLIKAGVTLPIILYTEVINHTIDQQALQIGAVDYLAKEECTPFLLEKTIRYAIGQHNNELVLERLSNYDALTDLPNRSLFNIMVSDAIVQAQQDKTYLAILYLDIDQLKKVNNSLGHSSGDIVLKMLANRLSSLLQGKDCLARMGDDEFAIMMLNIKSPQKVIDLAQKIINFPERFLIIKGRQVNIHLNIGMAYYPHAGKTAEDIITNARVAMQSAKQNELVPYQFFTQELQQAAERHRHIEMGLPKAIQQSELDLYYQPIFALQQMQIVASEALIRWDSSALGHVSGGELISIAEESDLIVRIGKWVITHACKDYQSIANTALRLNLNLSSLDLINPDIVNYIKNTLQEFQFAPDRLVIELTESVLMEDVYLSAEKLHQLREIGIKIAIDDYGTGYSSLSYLKHLPIDLLKIDARLIKDIPDDANDCIIVASTIDLAHNLGFKVIAEGIENESQLLFLKENDCDFVQGYHLSRAVDLVTLQKMVI